MACRIIDERPDTDALAALNGLIARSLATWAVSPRVKRAALSSYQYDPFDLADFTMLRAHRAPDHALVGVAAIGLPVDNDGVSPDEARLLHAIFVEPDGFAQGIGTALLAEAERRVAALGVPSLVVRAQRDAVPFFEKRGYRPAEGSVYAHSLIKSLDAIGPA